MSKAIKEIKKLVQADKMDFETAFEALAKDGICPCLLNDDFGNWAVSFEGYQSVPENPGKPSDIDTSFFIKKSHWEKTIKKALINALSRD